jgi:hypothetical protein
LTKLAYIKIVALTPSSFAGGVMVVDLRGLPLDFRYTDPVQPSRVQQLLFGKALDRHVRQDVIFKHLAEKLEPKPTFLLVDDELLLNLSGAAPVVLVTETRLAPLREASQLQSATDAEFLLQVGEAGSPLRFKLGKPEPGLAEKVADAFLEAARQGLEIVEPFSRIRGAVNELCSAPSTRE